MKIFLLITCFPLAITGLTLAEASTSSERKLIKAIQKDDTKTVEANMHFRRNPNTVIEPSRDIATGYTLMHHAAHYGSTRVVELLLKAGADPLRMNSSMEYPIELAIRNDEKNIIKLLSLPEDKRKTEEITTELLFRIVAESYLSCYKTDIEMTPVYVSLNDKDPPDPQMKRLRSLHKQFTPFSKIRIDSDEHPEKARATGVKNRKVYISLKASGNGISFDWSFGISSGPLSGGGTEGNFVQRYGYWIKETTKHWVS